MGAIEPEVYPLSRADLLATDRSGRPVLLVELKQVTPVHESILQLIGAMRSQEPPIPFGMLIDPESVRVYGGRGTEPVATLRTADVLSRYEPNFAGRRIYEGYLTALVEAWVRDLAFGWKSDEPPGKAVLEEVGLARLLEGASTAAEVRLGRRGVR